ncbi:MAG: GntR family transcriptional regulator [Thiolinea sp.]
MFKSLSTPKKRLADQVYDQLLDAIHNGVIQPNDQIVQEKLAEQFEISRTPVREALLRLEQEKIIEVAKRGGFKIRIISERETEEIYRARAAIECYAVRMLALNHSPALLDTLRQKIQNAESLTEHTVKAYFKANQTIHRAFVEACGNRYLLEMFDNTWNRGTSFRLFASIDAGAMADSLGDHEALVDVVASGDPVAAFEKMMEHIEDGLSLQRVKTR